MANEENYLYFSPPDPEPCSACEVMLRRIEAIHGNSEAAMKQNKEMKTQIAHLTALNDHWRERATRKYADAPEVGDLHRFYQDVEDAIEELVDIAEEYGIHKRVYERIESLVELLEANERYGRDTDGGLDGG